MKVSTIFMAGSALSLAGGAILNVNFVCGLSLCLAGFAFIREAFHAIKAHTAEAKKGEGE